MKSIESLIKTIFSNPTAPYREHWVLDAIASELKSLKVPFTIDKWGNIIANSQKKSKPTALVAHTDHPGFHILKKLRHQTYQARWFGGCPPKIKKATVAIYHPEFPESYVQGIIQESKLGNNQLFTIKVLKDKLQKTDKTTFAIDSSCFGAFDFPGFKKQGSKIITRAADDLAGVVIILATMARLKKKERKNLIGVFTRGEETGFRGTLGAIYSRSLPKNTKAISLEASRTLEGALIGKGPVIRLGDRKSLFDSSVIAKLDLASNKLMFQRRIMNGGTCEATPLNFYGIPSGGIAIPLGNYHNQKPDGKPGPEFIALKDVETAVRLCVAYFKNESKNTDPVLEFKKSLESGFKKDQKFLLQKLKFKKRRERG